MNVILPGLGYGWPFFTGRVASGRTNSKPAPHQEPLIESGATETWAPGGAAVVSGTLYFGGLRGEALYALDLQAPTGVRELFKGEFGRIRDVVRGPDGALYLTTSNRDGRGTPRPGDDKILRVDPAVLTE